jgi:hypothetical protein
MADDGPALQRALDAIGLAGGGTLFVPAGRYAIHTPVSKDFTGLASEVSLLGVESFTPVAEPNATGQDLTRGLDLTSEFAPRTGEQGFALAISGLQNFLIKDIAFIGTPGVNTDAAITLALSEISQATISHCEFYGLSSIVEGGAIVQAFRSSLTLQQSVFLGCTANGGVYTSVVQNLQWKGLRVTETLFVDYGQGEELYGKLDLSTPFSWVSLGNAAEVESDSPRREAMLRKVFFDEGSLAGFSSIPYKFTPPNVPIAPIDLVYISGLYMNVTNLGLWGNYIDSPEQVLIENSHYGWSHNADSAIDLHRVGKAILDRLECTASADRIHADSATGSLAVIDSIYNRLDSQAQTTRIITTNAPDEDPVQYVRQQFTAVLGHAPDPAAHFYWSDQILQCGDNPLCVAAKRADLGAYLASAPQEKFVLSGKIIDETGAPQAGVIVALGGSQNVIGETDANGQYRFANLPTSGSYTVTLSQSHYTFSPASAQIVTPATDQVFNSAATLEHHAIAGRVTDAAGTPLGNATVTLSGAESKTATTGTNGTFIFADLSGEGDYMLTPRKTSYAFSPASETVTELDAGQTLHFAGTLVTYSIGGILVSTSNLPLAGAEVMLSDAKSRTTTTDSAGRFSFAGLPSERDYTVTPTLVGYSFTPSARSYTLLAANEFHTYVGGPPSVLAFSAANYNVAEGMNTILVTVERTGTTTNTTEVTYTAVDGSAQQRSDVDPVIGRLIFEPGQTSQTFPIFITDDAYLEGNESINLLLGDVVGGVLGNNSSATLAIVDNDSSTSRPNPIDDAQFFVHQHYLDFLNRSPDAAGQEFWSNQILSCGRDTACIADRRVNVSAAFFLSIEFQQTGFLVYRLYQASFARPPAHFKEFLLDTGTIAKGVVVNNPGWEELLAANKTKFLEDFVARPDFTDAYPYDLSPVDFVDKLNARIGGVLSASDLAWALEEFDGAATSEDIAARARVLDRVAENETFSQSQLNPAFVLMQYFGYLQRNPSEAPDNNLDGYHFWLRKLDEAGGDFRRAEMVKAFLLSGEYRSRFGTP